MSYVVIKTVKGRRYRYLQTSWREGKRVRTKSICLGALDGGAKERQGPLQRVAAFIRAQRLSPEDRAMASADRAAEQSLKQYRDKLAKMPADRVEQRPQVAGAKPDNNPVGRSIGAADRPFDDAAGKGNAPANSDTLAPSDFVEAQSAGEQPDQQLE